MGEREKMTIGPNDVATLTVGKGGGKLEFKDDPIPVSDALAIVVRKAAEGPVPPPPPVLRGFVCKACGVLLASRDGGAASGKKEDECPGSGPHVAVLVDLNTIVVDENLRVTRAVHLE